MTLFAHSSNLSSPVSVLMRPTARVSPDDSLGQVSIRLRNNGTILIPVVVDDRYAGVISESSLGKMLAASEDILGPASLATMPGETIRPYESGAEALRKLEETHCVTLVVVDDARRVLGVLSATDLYPHNRPQIRPALIGGLATPFGVYLTTGTESGGAPPWALMSTGAYMFGLLLIAQTIVSVVTDQIHLKGISPDLWLAVINGSTLGLFFLGMRLVPLAGIHGAEHQVVHAIERGEPLELEVVRRMPRVHPRCGTNYFAFLGIFLTVSLTEWLPILEIRLLVALALAFIFWRKVGNLMQFFVTTKSPSDPQLQSGIRAGEQLLERYALGTVVIPSIGKRLWSSGIFHVFAGLLLSLGLLKLLVVGVNALFKTQIDLGI